MDKNYKKGYLEVDIITSAIIVSVLVPGSLLLTDLVHVKSNKELNTTREDLRERRGIRYVPIQQTYT